MIKTIRHDVKRLTDSGEAVDAGGVSEFMEALHRGQEEAALALANRGADLFRIAKSGSDTLIFAALGGSNKLLTFLLDHGVKPGARNGHGQTAVNVCCRNGNFDGLRLLLKAGADLKQDPEARDGRLIATAVWGRNPELLEFLVQQGIPPDYQEGFIRPPLRTPLMLVSHWGRADLARVLLDAGANPNAQDENGNSPLQAARPHSPHLVNLLIRYGADPTRVPGPCHLCGQGFFQGDYLIGQSDFGHIDWRCSWCGRPTCSDCAGVKIGMSSDEEHKLCRSCQTAQGIDSQAFGAHYDTIWKWAHRRENVGRIHMSFQCPGCGATRDLADSVKTCLSCWTHGMLCRTCLPHKDACPLCRQERSAHGA